MIHNPIFLHLAVRPTANFKNGESHDVSHKRRVTLDDAVTGFISCHTQYLLHHCGIVAEIQELFVGKPSRKMVIGKALVNSLLEKL
jgi:PhnO protein